MARQKIDYGIDLGTTNSAISRMEKGVPVTKKIEVTDDTMPSCVYFNRQGNIVVGASAYSSMKSDKKRATKSWEVSDSNTFVEFKRTMGTDTIYHSSNMQKKGLKSDWSSEELSAEVLKALRSFITDEAVNNAVITVPAKFTVNQKTATLEAAKLAGFKRCELLQEPIAASMAYGLNSDEKNGVWMVFDFGGGTFDAALLKVEDGIMQVFDTEGDNFLGGKNLDYAIVDEIIIPYIKENYVIDNILSDDNKKMVLRDAMKTYAEDAKNQLSFKDTYDILSDLGDLGEDDEGEEIELDLTVSQEETFKVMRPHFQKAVDICKTLLKRNDLTGQQVSKLILVGGPTHSPLIRKMLKEQVTPNVDTSIDPMTAVATGAALYASTIDAVVSDDDVKKGTVKLDLGYESTTVETDVWISASLPADSLYDKVQVELVRSDNTWSSGRVEVDKTGNVIEANLLESKPNSFAVKVYDETGNLLPCFPSEITIIQGTKVGAAPLPYNIGIGVWNQQKQRVVFRMARGLEKNKPVPATGVINDLKTSQQLRPGVEADTMRIPIYQVDDHDLEKAEGRTASLYEYVADVIITGDDVDELIPEDALVDLTLKVDTSEQMTLEAHFLASDITVEKQLDTTKKQSISDATKQISDGFASANRNLANLREEGIDTSSIKKELDTVKTESDNSSEKKAVLQHLKEVMRKIEDLEEQTEWQRLEKKLREAFARVERAQEQYGNDKSAQIIEQLRPQVDEAISKKNISMGNEMLEQVESLFFALTQVIHFIVWIQGWQRRFGSIRWKDRTRANQLVNQGASIINTNPTADNLAPIVQELVKLLPEGEKPAGGEGVLQG